MKACLKFLCFVVSLATVFAADYCNKFCKSVALGGYIPHIGCNNNDHFTSYCPSNAKLVPITNSLKNLLVEVHNQKRNFIAGGGDPGHSPACRMATMEWDDELAYLASLNVKRCDFEHDHCHRTDAFEYSGQNLAQFKRSGFGFDNDTEILKETVEAWYDEVHDSRQSYIDSYPENYQGPQIGHFTVMMADRNIRVGCAASIFTRGMIDYYLVACNYATTNMIHSPIYVKCDTPAASCTTGTNSQYPNLCSAAEHYDVNKWF